MKIKNILLLLLIILPSFSDAQSSYLTGTSHDVSSYLPTHMHIEKRGYVGLNSFFWYGMPAVFPMNVDETILNRIKSLDR